MGIRSVCWNVTSRCNLHCAFCYRHRDLPELPKRCWPEVLQAIRSSGAARVVFGGGEPFLLEDLPSLVRLGKEAGLVVSVITNGTFVGHAAFAEVTSLCDEVVFSIDGPDAPSHAQIRGAADDLFSTVLDFLRTPRRSGLRLRVNTVATRESAPRLLQMAHVLASVPLDEWRILQFYPLARANDSAGRFEIDDAVTTRHFERAKRRVAGAFPMTLGTRASMDRAYVSIAPDGRLFSSRPGETLWVGHVLTNPIDHAFSIVSRERHANQYHNVTADRII